MLEAVALALALLTAGTPAGSHLRNLQDPEETAIRAVFDLYFTGMKTGDAESLKRAFHPDAMLYLLGEGGRLQGVTQSQWYDGLADSPHAAYRSTLVLRVESIDRTGDARPWLA